LPYWYAGLLCEHVINVCPGGEHVCFFHGSDCIADGSDKYTCDCATGEENGVPTAGEFCQHEATAVCDVSVTNSVSTMVPALVAAVFVKIHIEDRT
jgi:hypothetical protein